jgi:hypothetical protein
MAWENTGKMMGVVMSHKFRGEKWRGIFVRWMFARVPGLRISKELLGG